MTILPNKNGHWKDCDGDTYSGCNCCTRWGIVCGIIFGCLIWGSWLYWALKVPNYK